ncbi:MAG: VCBS repeat-containing protein [Candidatus Neomarinimicrobiota bacterium]|nr:MAG: VCBS repeat-containing protein [Candidatus Neomarinimicrobiota bacterium]
MIVRRLAFGLLLLTTFLRSGPYRIHALEGPYDFSGNNQPQYIALAEDDDGHWSHLSVFQIGADGYQEVVWELTPPEDTPVEFAGFAVGDLNGNGYPELITVMNTLHLSEDVLAHPIVLAYEWSDSGFPEEPTIETDVGDGHSYLRCQNFDLGDIDGDGDMEVALTLGSPTRSLWILDQESDTSLAVVDQIRLADFAVGIGSIYVKGLDFDWDGVTDWVVFSPEGSVLKVQVVKREGNGWTMDAVQTPVFEDISGLLFTALRVADWDLDGFLDILLPFRSGDVLAITPSFETVAVDRLPVEPGPLSDFRVADLNGDGFHDLLFISGETNLLSVVYGDTTEGLRAPEYYSLENDSTMTQVFLTLPVTRIGRYTGTLLAAGWNGLESSLAQIDLGYSQVEETALSAPPVPASEAAVDTTGPEAPPEAVPALGSGPSGIPLPPDVLPRHVLPVNQPFAYAMPEEEGEAFFSLRWLAPPPPGMYFHYESQSIRWVPDDTNLGAYLLEYFVQMKVGEEIQAGPARGSDSLVTYQVVPKLEGREERLWIYVNDPPVFISEPSLTEFLTNDTFTYRPVVRDRNVDAHITLGLERGPEGMVLEDGELVWHTDSSNTGVYEVRLVASDGFDRTAQEFKLFPRAGVRILSHAPVEATVNEPYSYRPEIWHQALEYPLEFRLPKAPEGMTVDSTGLVHWVPTATQVDTQRFQLVVQHGVATDTERVAVFVNHPPVIVHAPAPMIKLDLGDTWEFTPEVLDPNAADELSFIARELPEGMRMDPFNGRLHWEPSADQLDFSHLQIDVTDGRETRSFAADFFVNAPVKIVSLPPMTATVGEAYQYKLVLSDLNQATLLPLEHVVRLDPVALNRVYTVKILDEVALANIDRYLGDWNTAEAVYWSPPDSTSNGYISRLNLKKYVPQIFWEQDRLYVVISTVNERTVNIKDVLWEFFHGNQGKPPKVTVARYPVMRYTLTEFPEGMTVDEVKGTLNWTPTKDQVDIQRVSVTASDGYTKDEQSFEIYVNHPPVIVSTAPDKALVGEPYVYQVQVEDLNQNAELEFTLVKGPRGMQMDRHGKVVWVPEASQIDNHVFEVRVSDGYRTDSQVSEVFVNIAPTILSHPKPVTLAGYEYRYKVIAEDLNKDKITFRSVRLPKYATFNRKTGMFTWKARNSQKGPNDVIILAIDEHGAATTHQFQIHVFEDPGARQFVNTGWPLMLTFVGVIFAWGVSQI